MASEIDDSKQKIDMDVFVDNAHLVKKDRFFTPLYKRNIA